MADGTPRRQGTPPASAPAAHRPPGAEELLLSAELAVRVLTEFIREEVTKVGLERVVVGLPGGIDSALAAALATRALGSRNVTALAMPYRTSGPDSLQHAREVAAHFNLEVRTIEITPMIDARFRRYEPEADAGRRGTTMARERMAILSPAPRRCRRRSSTRRRHRRDERVALGFAPALVDAVLDRVQGSQFRRRLPVIARLSHRTIDRDFRYPRDWMT